MSDLRNIDFAGKAAKDLTLDDARIIAARYNQGPDKPLSDVKKDLVYGESVTSRWAQLGDLLKSAPAKLEYAPIKNSVVDPINRWLGGLQWEIKRTYGIAY